jgi:AAA15 family ATPase/GTPase
MTRSRRKIKTIHKVFDQKGLQMREQKFDLDQMESSGTQKIFDIIGPIFWVLKKGGIAVIDELDAKLHPLLTRAFIRIFNSEENNPHNAQLVFASHDINLLSYGHFRRDQIYFVEKDHFGASNLYSLIEFKEVGQGKIRKDRSFEKDYIQGRYGSIPFLGDFSKLIQQWQGEEKLTAN